MRNAYRFLAAVIFSAAFCVPSSHAQTSSARFAPDTVYNEKVSWHISIYTGLSHIFGPQQGGLLQLTFPYRIYDFPGGPFTTKTFTGSTNGLSPETRSFFTLPGLQVSRNNIVAGIDVCPFRSTSLGMRMGVAVQLGYRIPYELAFGTSPMLGLKSLRNICATFPVTLSLGISTDQFIWKMGSPVELDSAKTFSVFNVSLANTEKDEQENGKVDVLFQESVIAFTPSVSVGIRPVGRFFDIRLQFGPYIPFDMHSGLSFLYRDTDDSDNTHLAPSGGSLLNVSTPGLQATFNHERFSEGNPFTVKGWLFGVYIGLHTGAIHPRVAPPAG